MHCSRFGRISKPDAALWDACGAKLARGEGYALASPANAGAPEAKVEMPPRVVQASMPDHLADRVVVERQVEIRVLQVVLEDVLAGRGRLVMLVGTPGIGKMRTARELASRAELRGA